MRKITKKLQNHFFPHEENEHHPHFLRYKSIALFFLIIIIFEFGFLIQKFVVLDRHDFLGAVLPTVLTGLTNSERNKNNLNTLSENPLLVKAAQMKAQDMAERGYFSHNTPEGKTPWYWLDLAGYKYRYAGENLAVNFFESNDVARAWMASPTHKANILKDKYTEIGIGVASGTYQGQNAVFVAQFFGTPAETKISPVASVLKTGIKNVQVKPPLQAGNGPSSIQPKKVKVLGEEAIEKFTSSPRKSVSFIYYALGIFVALILSIFFIKSKKRHPSAIARGLALIFFIALLLLMNKYLYSPDTLVPKEGPASNEIAF